MGLDAGLVGSDVAALPALTPRSAGWVLPLYPKAGEGGGCFVSSYAPKRSAYVARGDARDPKRAAEEAGRRARGKLRRYGAANRLNKLGPLTYETACHDTRQVRADVGEFFRALREGLGGKPLPYVWVPEWHPGGHGLHVHFAVGRYAPIGLIRSAWGRGHVSIKLLGDLPVGADGVMAQARVAARYLSKYVTKTFTDDTTRVKGLHRYDVGQGFQPRVLRLRGRSSDDVLGQASKFFGMAPAYRWSSADVEGWFRRIGPAALTSCLTDVPHRTTPAPAWPRAGRGRSSAAQSWCAGGGDRGHALAEPRSDHDYGGSATRQMEIGFG